jgi:hypothetical protein
MGGTPKSILLSKKEMYSQVRSGGGGVSPCKRPFISFKKISNILMLSKVKCFYTKPLKQKSQTFFENNIFTKISEIQFLKQRFTILDYVKILLMEKAF